MRETKAKEKKNLRERREAAKKRKADAARKARAAGAAGKKASRPRKMTPSEAGRHGAWCKKMQSWGAYKKKRGF